MNRNWGESPRGLLSPLAAELGLELDIPDLQGDGPGCLQGALFEEQSSGGPEALGRVGDTSGLEVGHLRSRSGRCPKWVLFRGPWTNKH